MKKFFSSLVLIAAITLPLQQAAAQRRQNRGGVRRPRPAAATVSYVGSHTEPVRALTGRMSGNKIMARMSDDRSGFDYVITGAQVVDGKLQFQGTINQNGTPGAPIAATLIGTLSRARNPWPGTSSAPPRSAAQTTGQPAAQPQGREARNPETAGQVGQLAQSTQSTARTTQTSVAPEGRRPDGGEVTEQTQSLYTAIDTGTGCEIFYLKMQLPPAMAAAARANQLIQLGVVLNPMDNKIGEQINQHVCRVVRSLNSTQDAKNLESQVAQLNQLLAGKK